MIRSTWPSDRYLFCVADAVIKVKTTSHVEISGRQQKGRFNWQVNYHRIEQTGHGRRRWRATGLSDPLTSRVLFSRGSGGHGGAQAVACACCLYLRYLLFQCHFVYAGHQVIQGEFASVKTNVIYSCKQHNDYLILQITLTFDTWRRRPCTRG